MKFYSVQVGAEKFQIDEAEHTELQRLIKNKERGMFEASGGSFLIERVSSIKNLSYVDYRQDEPKREYVSDEQRAKNMVRIHVAKLWLQKRTNPALAIEPKYQQAYERFAAYIASPKKQERIRRKQEFIKEYFDVYFKDNEELETCFQSWLKATDPNADPSLYNRDDHTPEALGLRDEELSQVREVFGV